MVMKKKPTKKMMAGGRTKGTKYKAAGGGKMPMVKQNGKMIPAFAADGKGKMARGGRVKKAMGGNAMKKRAKAAGGGAMKKRAKAMGGGAMKKRVMKRGGGMMKKPMMNRGGKVKN